MTSLPEPGPRKLGLVIDLDTCVGCHACAVACKSWNTGGQGGPLADTDAYGEEPEGIWFNRVHTFETEERTVHFPRSCLHCENAACVTVCPTGASYKRAEDGIVLVDPNLCIGCKLCSWACPYGARELDPAQGVMKKCTLCVDRIYNETLDPGRPGAGLCRRMPDPGAAFRGPGRPGVRRLEARAGARGSRSHARAGLQAGEQVPAAARTAGGGA